MQTHTHISQEEAPGSNTSTWELTAGVSSSRLVWLTQRHIRKNKNRARWHTSINWAQWCTPVSPVHTEIEAGTSEVHGHLWPHKECEASQSYMRSCLQNKGKGMDQGGSSWVLPLPST